LQETSQKKKQAIRDNIRQQIARHVEAAFPGCTAVFGGKPGRVSPKSRIFGFRVRAADGSYRSNYVWVDPTYAGEINEAWVRAAVRESNG
jgi:hypothetical protein